jgi:hypothetical protein
VLVRFALLCAVVRTAFGLAFGRPRDTPTPRFSLIVSFGAVDKYNKNFCSVYIMSWIASLFSLIAICMGHWR